MVRKDHALALITEIEHMEMEKRTNHRLTLEEPTEKTKRWWGSTFALEPAQKTKPAHLKGCYSPPFAGERAKE